MLRTVNLPTWPGLRFAGTIYFAFDGITVLLLLGLLLSFILLEFCAEPLVAAVEDGWGLELVGRTTAAKADSSSPFSKSIRSL